MNIPAPANEVTDAGAIRAHAEAILQDPMYHYAGRAQVEMDLEWITRPIQDFLRWLDDLMSQAPAGTSAVIYTVLIGLLFALLGHIIYSLIRSARIHEEPESGVLEVRRAPASALVSQAEALAHDGNYVDASRLLYEAALTMLEEKRRGHIRKGLTATEYLRTFQAPWVVDNLRVFVNLINWKWYRARAFDASDYMQCRSAFEAIRDGLSETAEAAQSSEVA